MDTLLRNATLRFSRRSSGHGLYEPLDQTIGDDNNYRKISASRRKVISHVHHENPRDDYNKGASGNSVRSKRERAKKRLIFLQSYKLGSDSGKLLKSRKLKKAAIKVKSVAVSLVSFMRISSSPRRIPAFC